MAEPRNAGLAGQRRQFALAQRIAAVGVGAAGEQEIDGETLGAQLADRRYRVEHSLAAQHASDERNRAARRLRL